jgi:imidazolonepropionase-like amidohydrolase
MKRPAVVVLMLLAFGVASSYLRAQVQKVVVIHAGQMFDGKSDALVSNQVVVIQGDRIAEVGPAGSVKIPAGAEEIDLGTGTLLPGLIEGHNHMFKSADHPGDPLRDIVEMGGSGQSSGTFSAVFAMMLAARNAKLDLDSGFTTARDLSSGGTSDVDLRKAINEGIIPGPRMCIATEGMRGSIAGPPYFHLIDSPWEGRKQVRVQLKNGADFIKIYAAGIRANPDIGYGAPTMTLEEEQAIVDEAHRQGVRVACTAHAGIAVPQSIEAGCNSLELVTDIKQEDIQKVVEKGIFMDFGLTITKLQAQKQNFPMAELSKASFQRALKAGVKIAFAANATGAHGTQLGPYHGEEAVEFPLMVQYGMTPLQAIRTATSGGAANLGWQDRVGSIEKGKYADFIGVSGNPVQDVTELQRVKFVMKGGQVVRDSLSVKARVIEACSGRS